MYEEPHECVRRVSTTAWTTLTVSTGGGVVVISHRPEEVRLESASPAPGYSTEIDKSGLDEVRVEFEGATESVEVRVRWRGGHLETDIDHGR
ncbi:hypothetical protein BH23ACT5_BH23ACT5_11410 [soil metagenome]